MKALARAPRGALWITLAACASRAAGVGGSERSACASAHRPAMRAMRAQPGPAPAQPVAAAPTNSAASKAATPAVGSQRGRHVASAVAEPVIQAVADFKQSDQLVVVPQKTI